MEPKYVKINGFLYGTYRPDGFEYGRNGIRKKLCSLDDLDYVDDSKKKKRTESGAIKYAADLYFKKFQELLAEKTRPKISRSSVKVREAFQQFLENKQVVDQIDKQTLENYMRTFSLYVEVVGNHAVDRFEKDYETKFIRALRDGQYRRGKCVREGRKPVTVNTHISRVNTFLSGLSPHTKCLCSEFPGSGTMRLRKRSRIPGKCRNNLKES